jgi:V8-like Glu-specific endopeptidase
MNALFPTEIELTDEFSAAEDERETSSFPEQPLLSCPDAVGDLGALRNALAILNKRLNRSPLDRSAINNARLDFTGAARKIIQRAKGGGYVRSGCTKGSLLRLVKGVDRLRTGLAATSTRRATLNAVMAAVSKAAQSAPRGEEIEEIESDGGRLEWTEDELQYSIINSPTSPGDDRFRITPRSKRPSTLMFPFNTICLLERHHLDDRTVSRVTGTLIAPQVVLTAKHCLTRLDVRTAAKGPRFSRIVVSPGADLSAARDQRPADPASISAPAARFRVHPTLDFGVIILPKAFRRPVQFMRLQPRDDANTATLLTIAGYPCDKPRGTMWGHSERIRVADISATHLRYVIDTCPGHSGSPIWLLGNNAIRLLLGIHTNGPAGCVNDPASGNCRATSAAVPAVSGLNGGVRVTCEVIDHILAWCREFKVTPPTTDPTYRQRCTR